MTSVPMVCSAAWLGLKLVVCKTTLWKQRSYTLNHLQLMEIEI